MFERYTEDARRAIFFARKEALVRSASEIGTQHIVLGLTYGPALEDSEIGLLQNRRDEVFALFGLTPLNDTPTETDLTTAQLLVLSKSEKKMSLSRGAKIALAFAAEEADRSHSRSIDRTFLLRGVVCTGDETARALAAFGWTRETLGLKCRKLRHPIPTQQISSGSGVWTRRKTVMLVAVLVVLAALILYLRWRGQQPM